MSGYRERAASVNDAATGSGDAVTSMRIMPTISSARPSNRGATRVFAEEERTERQREDGLEAENDEIRRSELPTDIDRQRQ